MSNYKKLMNILFTITIFHSLLIIICLASLKLFDSEILGMTYLEHYTMFEMLVTLFLGPVIVVLVNSVAMKKLTIWHR
jgi:hypothetical protein